MNNIKLNNGILIYLIFIDINKITKLINADIIVALVSPICSYFLYTKNAIVILHIIDIIDAITGVFLFL